MVAPGPSPNAFATDDSLSAELPAGLAGDGDPGSYFGWAFASTSPQQIAASQAGEIHPYYVRFKGPTDVLEWLRSRYPTEIALGPDNNYYTADANNPDTPEAHILAALRRVRSLPLVQSPWDAANEALGFYYGLGAQAVDDIKGLLHIAVLSVEFQYAVPKYLKAYVSVSVGVANDQECQMVAGVGTTAEQVSAAGKLAWDLWVAVEQSQWGTLEAAASGDLETAWAKSETCRWIAAFMIEAMVAIQNEYAESTAFKRGEIKGRVTLEAVLIILPMTKAAQVGQLSKVEFLTQLKNKQWIQESAALRNILNKVLELAKGNKPVPPIVGFTAAEIPPLRAGAEIGGAGERVTGAIAVKVGREGAAARRTKVVTILTETLPNAGERNVAARLRTYQISVVEKLPHTPSPDEYFDVIRYSDLHTLKTQKRITHVLVDDTDVSSVLQPFDGFCPQDWLVGHHWPPEYVQDRFIELGVAINNENDCPVQIIIEFAHGQGGSTSSIHNLLRNGPFPENPAALRQLYQTPQEMMDALIRFVKNSPDDEVKPFAKALRGWANELNIPFTE